jgi:multidrug transporter EmrE-like cation transporter
VAFSMGFLLAERQIPISEIPLEPWFMGALFLGALFVSIFFVMAMTAQKNGVSVTSIAGKMSVVVPVIFGVILYNESVTFLKLVGILIALLAVYLSSVKEQRSKKNGTLFLPVLLFIGSGTIDTLLKYIQENYVADEDISIFSGSLFGIAGIFAFFILVIKMVKKRTPFGLKNILAGIILGVPNYYSIIFLIKALQNKNFESSTLFTINNVAIVVVSTLVGLFFFKEKFSIKNKIGVAMAILGIVLVTIA